MVATPDKCICVNVNGDAYGRAVQFHITYIKRTDYLWPLLSVF